MKRLALFMIEKNGKENLAMILPENIKETYLEQEGLGCFNFTNEEKKELFDKGIYTNKYGTTWKIKKY